MAWCFLYLGGVILNNIQNQIDKLLLAFMIKGITYKINTKQFYSEKSKRFVTKYILWEYDERKDGEVFYSKIKLLLFLAERYKEVGGGDRERCKGKPD